MGSTEEDKKIEKQQSQGSDTKILELQNKMNMSEEQKDKKLNDLRKFLSSLGVSDETIKDLSHQDALDLQTKLLELVVDWQAEFDSNFDKLKNKGRSR